MITPAGRPDPVFAVRPSRIFRRVGAMAGYCLCFVFINGVILFSQSDTASLFAVDRFHPPVASHLTPAEDDRAVAVFSVFRAARLALPVETQETSLAAAGDIMLSRTVAARMREKGDSYPFGGMASCLRVADAAFGNLETAITPGREIQPGEMVFRAVPAAAAELAAAGFDAVSLANNHTPNFGQAGLLDTFRYLKDAGVAYCGAGENEAAARASAVVRTDAGRSFVFLSYNDADVVPASYFAGPDRAGTAGMETGKMAADAAAAKGAGAAAVIVSMHSGGEYQPKPNARQTAFAQAAVAAGADAVIGHHPHVVQTAEAVGGAPVFYSLGNFIFDQTWSRETQDGLLVWLVFDGGSVLRRVEFTPVVIEDASRPVGASGVDAARILGRLGLELGSRGAVVSDGRGGWTSASVPVWQLGNEESNRPSRLERRASALLGDAPVEIAVDDGTLSVHEGEQASWHTPESLWVDDFALADINGDGRRELAVLYWQADRSDQATTEDPVPTVDQRLSFYGLEAIAPELLFSAAVPEEPLCQMAAADLDGDGVDELAVIEGEISDDTVCRGRRLAVYSAKGGAIAPLWRGDPGDYCGLSVSCVAGRVGISFE